MRKIISIILIFILFTSTIYAADELTKAQLVEFANKELIMMGIYDINYFENSNRSGKTLSNSQYLTGCRNYIVYGDVHGDFKDNRYRFLGYTMSDADFTNYLFPNDITSKIGLCDRNWVEDPKRNPLTKTRTEVKDEGTFNNNPLYEESIRLGLKLISRKNPDNTLLDFPDEKLNEREWHKYVHVYQPPTSVSWGCGIMFHNPSGNQINYLTVPMSPEGLKGDIGAEFEKLPSSVEKGKKVQVGILIKSTFNKDLTGAEAPLFNWEIIKKTTNEPVAPVTYMGHLDKASGTLDIPANTERLLYAEFIMPDSNVKIKFEVNRDGNNPVETIKENNILDSGNAINVVKHIETTGTFDIDYNVLSRKVSFPLADGRDITAQLIAPRGSLYGNAWGSLNIENKTSDLLRLFDASDKKVTEQAGKIVKHPKLTTTIHRKDATYDSNTGKFDDPVNNKWIKTPGTTIRKGIITYDGKAYGNYEYHCSGCKTNGDESTYCPGHRGETDAAFNTGTDTRTITTKIYNGKADITPKVFENRIDNNEINSLQKSLLWTSEPYKFNVIRWMCHQDEENLLYDWTTVPGQYKRTFTQQNSATVKWEASSTMEKEYGRSREAAKKGDYRKTEYDKAVFASDTDFKNVEYPVKSGYYFNPTGTYTFTVETVTYKPDRADTKDHKELVDKVVEAFRYQSDLMYINSYKEPVNIQNELLPKRGNSYERRPAALNSKDPSGVDGVVLLKVLDRSTDEGRYSKKVEEIGHTEVSGGYTHEFWKEILEGYEESGTIDSRNNYKYREYVKAGQHMYRITERTTVTIKINPDNRSVYTHAHMTDGKYMIKAWIEDIDMSAMDNEYKKLGTLKGVEVLDQIDITVKGSMYDDLNQL